jgi:hypothetical protein
LIKLTNSALDIVVLIKFRVLKKLQRFTSEDLPLLIEKECLDVTESHNVTEIVTP